jgi:hypothetical protein
MTFSEDQRYAAFAFFVPHDSRGWDLGLGGLLELIEAVDIAPPKRGDPSDLFWCAWAGLDCRAYAYDMLKYRVLVLYTPRSGLLNFEEEASSTDRETAGPSAGTAAPSEAETGETLDWNNPVLKAIAEAFHHAVKMLGATTALLELRQGWALPEKLLSWEEAVAQRDLPVLERSGFALLHVARPCL